MFIKWGPKLRMADHRFVYGLLYCDGSMLDTVETELTVYASIACQKIFLPMGNHLGGLQRLGLSLEEAEGVTSTAKLVSNTTGQDTSSWPKVRDIIPDWEELALAGAFSSKKLCEDFGRKTTRPRLNLLLCRSRNEVGDFLEFEQT